MKATELQPENPQPWLWLGQLDLATGHPEDAIAAMNQVFVLNQPVDTTRLAARAVIVRAQAQIAQRAARGQVASAASGSSRDSGSAPGRAAS